MNRNAVFRFARVRVCLNPGFRGASRASLFAVGSFGLACLVLSRPASGLADDGRATRGPPAHEVYVWQRSWTPSVRESVAAHGKQFSRLVALAAEVSWKQGRMEVVRVAIDFAAMAAAERPVGVALRVGPYNGPFDADDGVTKRLVSLAAALVSEARTAGVVPAELQIDFDCAESKLDGYRVWIEAIRKRIAPVPLIITALPAWLKQGAFERLIAAADGYVLQVHSLDRPTDANTSFSLCDPESARRAVERAARLGAPFRVALPTYGYLVAFDRHDRFIGLSAEGPPKSWPDGVRLREVRADPAEISGLVSGWTAKRPPAMRGIIWYRLPASEDVLNWRWPTLSAVMAGRCPRENLRVETRRPETALVEVSLVNEGDGEAASLPAVEIDWHNTRLVAGDGLHGFELVETGRGKGEFRSSRETNRLAPGERWKIGWMRLEQDAQVRIEIRKP